MDEYPSNDMQSAEQQMNPNHYGQGPASGQTQPSTEYGAEEIDEKTCNFCG